MGHIHREHGQYDATVSAFILREYGDPQGAFYHRVLLHRHKLLGVWVQPGGHIELNEHPWSALTHELLEETGYSLEELRVVQHSLPIQELLGVTHPVPLFYRSHEFPGSSPLHFHTDAAYCLTAAAAPKGEPAPGESKELRWFTAEELIELPGEEIVEDSRIIALNLLQNIVCYRTFPATLYKS